MVKSTDGGQSWNGTGIGVVSALAIDPQNTLTSYAMAETAILKTTDGGATWSPKTTGLPALLLGGYLAIDPKNPSTIFAAVGTGLYKSTDGGGELAWADGAGRVRDLGNLRVMSHYR